MNQNHLPTIHFHGWTVSFGRVWRLENASLLIFVGWRFRFWRLLGEDFSDGLIFVMLELLEEVEMVWLAFLLNLLRSCEFQPYHHHIVAMAPLWGGGNHNEECFCFNLWGRETAMWASAQTWASNWAVELYRTYIEHFANRRTTLFGWWCSLQMSQIRKSWECRPWFFNGFLSSPGNGSTTTTRQSTSTYFNLKDVETLLMLKMLQLFLLSAFLSLLGWWNESNQTILNQAIEVYMGVSLNGGTPKMIIFSRETCGCWGNPPF